MRSPRDLDLLAVIAAGGILGALARYGLAVAMPHGASGFPWATFLTNMAGCLLIGMLMIYVDEVWPPHRFARPFLGIGVLGGFTTFSTYEADTRGLLAAGAYPVAVAYVFGSLLGGLFAVRLGVVLARRLARWHGGRTVDDIPRDAELASSHGTEGKR